MFGKDSDSSSTPTPNNDIDNTPTHYLKAAQDAKAQGKLEAALQLYLLSYQAVVDSKSAATDGVAALRCAWELSIQLKERSLAEYIFEKLEPFLSSDEIASYAEELRRLALDKLSEFGLSVDDMQSMADMLADDFPLTSTSLMKIPGSSFPKPPLPTSSHTDSAKDASSEDATESTTKKPEVVTPDKAAESFTYRDLVGFDRAIGTMHEMGFCLSDDSEFNDFLKMLSKRHGVDTPQSRETLLFRAFAREDANQFMSATVGELGLPTVRMSMEENAQGLPVLCVMASSDFKVNSHMMRSGFDQPAALMLEDVDMWGAPLEQAGDDFDTLALSQLSRGARDAINLIRSAVENPQVCVVASCSNDAPLEDFFFDLLDPITVVDIDVPNAAERESVWAHVGQQYPSLRFIDRLDLVRLSANMSRFDIYMAAREAVDQAYRESIVKRNYVPVTRQNLFDKLAAYQPLESKEYHELEDAAVEAFRRDFDSLSSIDDLLKGNE